MSKTVAVQDGDFYVGPSGQFLEVSDTTKGELDFVEEFLTEYIANEDYGNDLFSLVGGGVMSGVDVTQALEAMSSQKISDVVTRLQAQQQNDSYSTADERIGGISHLVVKADPTHPTNILYYVELVTESGNIINGNFIVSSKQAQPPTDVNLNVLLAPTPTSPSD